MTEKAAIEFDGFICKGRFNALKPTVIDSTKWFFSVSLSFMQLFKNYWCDVQLLPPTTIPLS